eukprot:3751744-Amphidinium_carterae.1
MQLQKQPELDAQQENRLQSELAKVKMEKQQAIAEEKFLQAAELKEREDGLLRQIHKVMPRSQGLQQALGAGVKLLETAGVDVILLTCDLEIAELCTGLPDQFWGSVLDDLKRW